MRSLSLLFTILGPHTHPPTLSSPDPSCPCSYAWALYCMFVFYQAISKLIKKFRPILKFASIKAIVFATYYQSLAVQASSMSPENVVKWNDFILCIEMVFFSSLLMIAFPTTGPSLSPLSPHSSGGLEFQGGIPDSKFIENVRSVLSVHDVVQVVKLEA
jgi:hypothetical protein